MIALPNRVPETVPEIVTETAPGTATAPVEEVGRTQQDRERNVGIMVHRFEGRAPQTAPPGRPHRESKKL